MDGGGGGLVETQKAFGINSAQTVSGTILPVPVGNNTYTYRWDEEVAPVRAQIEMHIYSFVTHPERADRPTDTKKKWPQGTQEERKYNNTWSVRRGINQQWKEEAAAAAPGSETRQAGREMGRSSSTSTKCR